MIEKKKEIKDLVDKAQDSANKISETASTVNSILSKLLYLLYAVIAAAIIYGCYWFYTNTSLSFTQQRNTTTETQIESFKEIGQWEFLAMSREEIIDTTAVTDHSVLGLASFNTSRHLARIYTGTLRLGIDIKEDTKDNPDWIKLEADSTLNVLLPRPHLIDENFLDEAATRALIEDGTWSHEEKGKLAEKAKKVLRAKCMNATNQKRAEDAAKEQVTLLLKTMGFKKVNVQIAE